MSKKVLLKDLKPYKYKTKVCGNIITIYNYSNTMYCGNPYEIPKYTIKSKREDGEKEDRNITRTITTLIDLINCNCNTYTKFITFTFKDIILDKKQALNEFNKFRGRFQYNFGYKLKYVMVSERQKERGKKEGNEGAWHFHMVAFISKKINFELLKQCWSVGSVDIKKIDSPKNISKYIVKYITKDLMECNLNDKLIYTSHGLKRPIIEHSMDIQNTNDLKKRYSNQYIVKQSYVDEPIICTFNEYEKE